MRGIEISCPSNGFNRQLAEIIITLDADLQDNPNDIHKFLEKINKVSIWLLVGRKRYDPISKTLPSKLAIF